MSSDWLPDRVFVPEYETVAASFRSYEARIGSYERRIAELESQLAMCRRENELLHGELATYEGMAKTRSEWP